MPKRNSRRKYHASKAGRPRLYAGPTPETLAKLRPCSIREASAIGAVDQDQMAAAYEIAEALAAVTGAVSIRTPGRLDESRSTGSGPASGRAVWLERTWRRWLARCADLRVPTIPVRLWAIDGLSWRVLTGQQQREALEALEAWIVARKPERGAGRAA